MRKKILGFTSIRSEYDLMSGLYQLLSKDNNLDFRLLVSGAHLSVEYGLTVKNIQADNINILAEIESLISADSLSSRLKTASGLLSSAVDLVKVFSPDLIIYAGDREDVLVASMISCFLGIPSIHFFGGDHASDGHIDNPIRHAVSKLASVHFVSTEEHKKRLMALGENAERVFVIGSVALDKFNKEPKTERKILFDIIKAKPHAYQHPAAIVIFHPIKEEEEVAGLYIGNILKQLLGKGYHAFVGLPNTDPGNLALQDVIRNFKDRPEVTFYGNLSRNNFVNLMRCSSLIIGNSSSGILESASIPIPCVNVGLRQVGRLAPKNVYYSDGTEEGIGKAIEFIEGESFKSILRCSVNPYGDGNSVENAYGLIKRLDFNSFVKKTEDPLNVCKPG